MDMVKTMPLSRQTRRGIENGKTHYNVFGLWSATKREIITTVLACVACVGIAFSIVWSTAWLYGHFVAGWW